MTKDDFALQNWLFTYNCYTKEWYAFNRVDIDTYWNGGEGKYPMYKNPKIRNVIQQIIDGSNN